MRITRRHVLALTLAGAGLAAGGAGALALRWWDRPAAEGLQAMSQDEYDFVQAVAEAWMPHGGTPELSGADANLGAFFDGVLARADDTTRSLLKTLLQVLDDKPIGFRFVPYRHLPLSVRQDILRDWLHHDNYLFRNAVEGFMALLSMGWTTHPEVARLISPWYGCGYGP